MRKLTAHIYSGLPENLQLQVIPTVDDVYVSMLPGDKVAYATITFQEGPINTPQDVNGWTNEALIAVLVDRLNQLNKPPYSCRENALAITNLEQALHWLHARTRNRLERGVEGKLEP